MTVLSHVACIHKCEGTSVASGDSCSDRPESALKGMWVNRFPGSLATPALGEEGPRCTPHQAGTVGATQGRHVF